MKKRILIIDDQNDARFALNSVIDDALSNLELDDEWEVIDSPPLAEMDLYIDKIESDNVTILLLDERLGEAPNASGDTVEYRGSELVRFLRGKYDEMPIYGITAHPADESVELYFALFEDVIRREVFAAKAEAYVERFIRAYRSYVDVNREDLTKLTQLSNKIVLGEASGDDKELAEAIQQKLQISVTIPEISNRREWLEEFTSLINEYEEVQRQAIDFLENKEK